MPLKADHNMSSDTHTQLLHLFGYVWILNFGYVWIRLDTFWIRILDTRTFFGYATILDTFGYAKGKLRSGIQKYPKVSKIKIWIRLDTQKEKQKEYRNGYPKVSKKNRYVL